jgi:hypothetical protein
MQMQKEFLPQRGHAFRLGATGIYVVPNKNELVGIVCDLIDLIDFDNTV